MVNKKRLISLTQQLIRIDSQNPGSNEARIARFVKDYLGECGIKVKIYEFAKHRSNVVALIKGRDKGHPLLITPHLDTVPKGGNWRFPPFSARIHQARIYGLGATDCKANLAVSLEVMRSLCENKTVLDYDLIFAATADEESGSALGLIPLLDKGILKPDAALVLDSDEFEIIVTQKGLIHLKLKLQGRRAHGAYPWRGVNAIDLAIKIIQEVKNKRFAYRRNKYLRPPTVNLGTIKGGDKVNIVADWCEFELDFRFLPGMSAEKIIKSLKATVKKYARKFKLEIEGVQQPFFIAERHPLVTQFQQAAKKEGVDSALKGSEGATVISFFQNKNIPAIATGFGCHGQAHTANEYVRIENLYKGARVLERFLKNYQFQRVS